MPCGKHFVLRGTVLSVIPGLIRNSICNPWIIRSSRMMPHLKSLLEILGLPAFPAQDDKKDRINRIIHNVMNALNELNDSGMNTSYESPVRFCLSFFIPKFATSCLALSFLPRSVSFVCLASLHEKPASNPATNDVTRNGWMREVITFRLRPLSPLQAASSFSRTACRAPG